MADPAQSSLANDLPPATRCSARVIATTASPGMVKGNGVAEHLPFLPDHQEGRGVFWRNASLGKDQSLARSEGAEGKAHPLCSPQASLLQAEQHGRVELLSQSQPLFLQEHRGPEPAAEQQGQQLLLPGAANPQLSAPVFIPPLLSGTSYREGMLFSDTRSVVERNPGARKTLAEQGHFRHFSPGKGPPWSTQ